MIDAPWIVAAFYRVPPRVAYWWLFLRYLFQTGRLVGDGEVIA